MSTVIVILSLLFPHFGDGDRSLVQTKSVMPQGSPIEITGFDITQPCHKDAQCLSILWKNRAKKPIVACEFRVFCFDAVKRPSEFETSTMYKRKVEPDMEHKSPTFLKRKIGSFDVYYICVVPERVLFEDDSIWQQSDEDIYKRVLESVNSDFDPQCLKDLIKGVLPPAEN